MKANLIAQRGLAKSASLRLIKDKSSHQDRIIPSIERQKPLNKKASQPKIGSIKQKKTQRESSRLTEAEKISYENAMLKRLNDSLERENAVLKKQVAFLNQVGASQRSSISKSIMPQSESIKDKIMNRLSQKRDAICMDTQSTTIYNSRLNCSKSYEDCISYLYDQYCKKRVVPALDYLYGVTKNYFDEYKDNYVKLQVLFSNSKSNKNSELSAKLQDLLFLFQVPILYKDKPKTLIKSISKEKIKVKTEINSLQNSRISDFMPQLSSPAETLDMLEKLHKIVLKSPKLLDKVKQSITFRKILKKLND